MEDLSQAVLVLGNYQQTIAVVRSLARAGQRVLVGCFESRSFTELSRHTSETWIHPDPRDRRTFLRALTGVLDARPDIRYVFPVGDVDLDVAALAYEELSPRCCLVMVEPGLLRACLEKPRMNAIAAAAGVPVPAGRLVADEFAALRAAVEEIGFPVLLKRPNSFSFIGNYKAVICRGWDDVETWRHELRSGPLLVQRRVRGPRHNCQIAAVRGEIVAYFENKNLRTDRADGTGIGVEWISVDPTPELRRHCETLAHATGYSGVGLLQFLIEDGRPYFLELNPRLGMPWELSYRCGRDFAILALRCADALHDRACTIAPAHRTYAVGKRCHWLLGDLAALAATSRPALETAAWIARIVVSFCRADFQLTWSWRDPLPTLHLYAGFARSRFFKLIRRAGAQWKTGSSV